MSSIKLYYWEYVKKLSILFIGWKVLILAVVACSPGSGYDTSSNLLFTHKHEKNLPFLVRYLAQKLTRWDAVYYVSISSRGYIFEQEWAFGWGMTRFMALCTSASGLRKVISDFNGLESVVGVLVAHSTHFLSVILLFTLTLKIFTGENLDKFAFFTACLHIISPAGVFLSAPYAESPCAFLSFAGILVFTLSIDAKKSWTKGFLILISGALFGIATTFRSNAILNGFLIFEEAIRALWDLKNNFRISTICHLFLTGLAGLFVGSGSIIPQYIAYSEYCAESLAVKRPWCSKIFPSIYQFVQSHYWDVGLFRYWKLSNLPLFLISAPMYSLILVSGIWALNLSNKEQNIKSYNSTGSLGTYATYYWTFRNLAISQLILAVGTFTTAHAQIISRTSSSYPVWIWFLAILLLGQNTSQNKRIVKGLTSYLITYGIVQAGLYSSFLPPA
ncbi:GPI mannosyltransferase 2 [Erysiphe neolycopersici]|uniref:GPI mannosyltransferase 2 n=1 Tax=Erysiphe neolycopersici TaxID=212602 RepID=A0A420HNS2_9PEZI|nr:GPI mannosyltransferase 2 [Erysiphe neolycopersici]